MKYDAWCMDCSGHGLLSGYTADGSDFTGAEECRTCAGSGFVWVSAKGRWRNTREARS
jgi:DnaJ-class molecular chaperone